MTNYGRIQEGVAGRDRSSGGVNEEEPTRQRQKKKPIKRCQIHANTRPDFALGRQSVVSQALEFRDTALRLLGSALLPVPQFSDLDLVGAGEGSEWLELGTLEYFRDQNQIQTLAVLGGCLVVAFNAVTKEYQVIMHNHSSAYWTVRLRAFLCHGHTMPSEFSEHFVHTLVDSSCNECQTKPSATLQLSIQPSSTTVTTTTLQPSTL